MVIEEIKPWNATLHLLNSTGKADQAFSAIQRRGRGLAGIIIGGWDEEGKLYYYLSEGIVMEGMWARFNDETIVQEPRIFRTLNGALRKMRSFSREEIERKVRERCKSRKITDETCIQEDIENRIGVFGPPPHTHIGLVFWQHPDAHAKPIADYLTMVGIRLPGCPTQ